MNLFQEIQNIASTESYDSDVSSIVSRYILALDSVKEINEQIIDSNDLHMLMHLVLYTLSGQFAVTDAFMVAYDIEHPDEQPVYLGIGSLEESIKFESTAHFNELKEIVFNRKIPIVTEQLIQENVDNDVVKILSENNIELLVPMIHKNTVFGIVGLGKAVCKRNISGVNIILLTAIINAVSPVLSLRSNEYFHLYNNSNQAIIILGPDFKVQKANKVAVNLICEGTSKVVDETSHIGNHLHEMFPEPVFASWVETLTSLDIDSSINHVRSLEMHVGKEIKHFEAFLTKINRRRHNVYSLLLTLIDVTKKKAASQRLSNLQKSAEKGQILSSISHELNNYLGVLAGGIELTKYAADLGDIKKIQKNLEKLDATCKSINSFSSELVGRKRHETCKSSNQLNDVISQCVVIAKLQNRFHDLEVKMLLSEGLPEIIIDEDEISQLILNVLNNAADAIKETDKSGVIGIRTSQDDVYVHMEIEDNGPGMSAEIKDKLFVENLTTKENGHGFGLTVSAEILKNHKAKYKVKSELNSGSVFKFSFPK